MRILETPDSFSNLQRELLKLYANNISEEDLLHIRLLISKYFADKATDSVEQFVKENNIDTETFNDWSNEHV